MSLKIDRQCILYGIDSSYVFEAIEIAYRSKIEIKASIDNLNTVNNSNIPNIIGVENLTEELLNIPVSIPLITPAYRQQLEKEVMDLGFNQWANFVDITAIIALSASLGEGININAGVVIGANSHFGKQVLINRSVSIGHDAIIENYVTFGPGCVICGHCTIGEGTFIGAGSTILPKVKIGSNAVIGAGSVVTKDVSSNSIVVGNPAKVVKEGIKGYNLD